LRLRNRLDTGLEGKTQKQARYRLGR
jgi:hypothetical protein